MGIVVAAQDVRMASTAAVVVRCGCSDEQKSAPGWHGNHNQVCPNPRAREDLGTIAYWHRNPLKRAAWRIGRILTGRGFR